MMGMLGYAAVGCACASLVVSILSIALPFWFYYEPPLASGKYYYGLWTSCVESALLGKTCASFTTAPDYFPAVRALEIMGLLLVAGAAIIGVLKLFAMKENQIFPLVAGGQAILAGIFMIIGAIVFGVKTEGLDLTGATLHAGFALAIVSGVIAFGAGGLFIASKSN